MYKSICLSILFLFTIQTFYSCDSDKDSLEGAFVNLEIYESGIKLVAKVTVDNVNVNKIGECGLYWQVPKTLMADFNIAKANQITQEGGKATYTFEFLPWDGMIEYSAWPGKVKIIAQAYISPKSNPRDKTFCILPTRGEYQTDIEASVNYKGSVVGDDYVTTLKVDYPDKQDIEECGVYWGFDQEGDFESNLTKVVCGNDVGELPVTIKDGAYLTDMHCIGYIKTKWGTYYSGTQRMVIPGENMTVSIASDLKDLTHERVTLTAHVDSDNPKGFPVTERGFCYINILKVKGKQYPTIDDETHVVPPGVGYFSGTISGLEPFAIYHIRAYAKNKKRISYSPSYAVVPTHMQSSHVPMLTFTYARLSPTVASQVLLEAKAFNDNGYQITERGFCYNKTASLPTVEDTKVIAEGTGLGSFNATVSNLPSGKYLFRPYSINQAGAGYSSNFLEVVIP